MNGLDPKEFKELFPDYDPNGNYRDYSIELEYGCDFHNTLQAICPFDHKRESTKIFEPRDIHKKNYILRHKLFTACKERYQDSFPIWANDQLSGWNHFHITIPKEIREDIFKAFKFNYVGSTLWNLMQNIPLYAKIYRDKYFSRPFFTSNSECNRALIWNDWKGYFVVVKQSYLTSGTWSYRSIEFRWNNVIDTRLYWYYLGCLRAAVFQDFELSSNKSNVNMLWSHNASLVTRNNPNPINETSLSYLYLKWEWKMIRNYHLQNIKAFVFYVNQYYPNAAKNLYEYIQERWIDLNIPQSYWDNGETETVVAQTNLKLPFASVLSTVTPSTDLKIVNGDMPSVSSEAQCIPPASVSYRLSESPLTVSPSIDTRLRTPSPNISYLDTIPF